MAEWFAMGNHGVYVWGSFGVTALFMVVETILVVRRKRVLMQHLSRMMRMNSEVDV